MNRLDSRRSFVHIDLGTALWAPARRQSDFTWRYRMLCAFWKTVSDRFARCGLAVGLILAAAVAPGCGHQEKVNFTTVTKPPSVRVTQPEVRNLVRIVGQPSFIEAYERSSVYPKLTGYIEEWNVDIGDKVKRGQTLATLFVPELVEDFGTKKATVKLDEQRIELAKKMVKVASADVKAAKAQLDQTKAILDKYRAEVERWDIEVKRLKAEVEKDVVDQQILLESINQLKASVAGREAAAADIEKAESQLLSKEATLEKASVDVQVAEADLAVAVSEAKRIEAWVGYLKLPAPFDGVVVVRNANTFDFVLPNSGDPTAMEHSPHLAPNGSAAPIYVVDRTDIVRIFVDIPEQDANYVHIGTKATVVAKAYSDLPIPGSVTRTSWALNVKSRTLRAEIDLKNPDSKLLPGMYAYAKVIIERPNVRALPLAALTYNGEKTFCWRHEGGKAMRTEVQTGVTDGKWIEVTNFQLPPAPGGDPWAPVSGSEQVILGDLSVLSDGGPVEVLSKKKTEEKIADDAPARLPASSQPATRLQRTGASIEASSVAKAVAATAIAPIATIR